MTLHDIASGKTPMEKCSYETLRKLADLLETSVDWIVDETKGAVPIKDMHWDKVDTEPLLTHDNEKNTAKLANSQSTENGIAPEAAYFLERPEYLSASFCFYDDVTAAIPFVSYYDYAVTHFYEDSWIHEYNGLEIQQEKVTDIKKASEKALVYLENLYFDEKIDETGFRFLSYAVAEKIRKDSLFPNYSNLRSEDKGMKCGIFAFYDFQVMCQSIGFYVDDKVSEDNMIPANIQENADKIRNITEHYNTNYDDVIFRCRPFFIYNGPALRTLERFVYNRISNIDHASTADMDTRKELYGVMDGSDEPYSDIWLKRFMKAVYTEKPDLTIEMENRSGEKWAILQVNGKILDHPYKMLK